MIFVLLFYIFRIYILQLLCVVIMSAQVQRRDYQDTVEQKGSSQISAKHINKNQERQQNNKNETSQKDSLQQQKAINRLMGGLQKVLSSIDFEKGMTDFTTAFNNIQTQQAVPPINSSTVHIENISFAPSNVDSLKNEQQIENLNKTPFFGSQKQLIKSKNAKKEGIQSLANKIISKISIKNQQAIQQFSEKVSNLLFMSFPKVFQKIRSKSQQAIQQFTYQYDKKYSSPHNLQTQSRNMEPISTAYFRQNQNIMDIEDDNQFMAEQFGTHHRLEQVKKYVDQIKTQNIQRYLQENSSDKKDIIGFVNKIQQIREKLLKRKYFQQLKAQREKNSLVQDQSNMKKVQDRSNSERVSQRMSSAQSQRLQSASKNSQNDQSFNLDLTMKTKLSKNLYKMGKGDSLMYSADSGFGFIPQNTHQNQNFEDIYQQKQRLIKSQRKGTLQKNHIERVQHQIAQKISKRIFSSKQKIEQFQQQQNEENSIANKQINQQNSQMYPEESENASGNQSKTLKPKYRDYQAQENQQAKNKSYIEQSKISNLDKKQVHEKHTQQKSMKKKKKQYQDQISQKEDTIINRVQNFDADDQDEQVQKSKELNQSVNLKKSRKKEKVRKRVQTEATKIQQEPPPKHNYSIKNIKRFNKVDFTKLQQKSHRSNSQATNSQNIFTTQISNYQNKITKLRQQKQLKKKHLQLQLARINNQIKILHQKQQQLSPENSPNNGYVSRVKISDNNQAQKKAQSLVKNLRSQKRNRNIAKIGQFSNLDKNINEYMEQLSRLRAENQQKIKYKKKLQILERMKLNQVRKMNQKKKITQNQQFVMHLKGIGNQNINIQTPQNEPNKRSPTKQSQQSPNPPHNNPTPQLSNKKAYLNKIRSFSIKKQKPKDAYEQLLG